MAKTDAQKFKLAKGPSKLVKAAKTAAYYIGPGAKLKTAAKVVKTAATLVKAAKAAKAANTAKHVARNVVGTTKDMFGFTKAEKLRKDYFKHTYQAPTKTPSFPNYSSLQE